MEIEPKISIMDLQLGNFMLRWIPRTDGLQCIIAPIADLNTQIEFVIPKHVIRELDRMVNGINNS